MDHGAQDWRDVICHVIPALGLPTLVFGGEPATILPPAAAAWSARRIAHAVPSIFSAAEGSSHSMFWEDPVKFNAVVPAFMARR